MQIEEFQFTENIRGKCVGQNVNDSMRVYYAEEVYVSFPGKPIGIHHIKRKSHVV